MTGCLDEAQVEMVSRHFPMQMSLVLHFKPTIAGPASQNSICGGSGHRRRKPGT